MNVYDSKNTERKGVFVRIILAKSVKTDAKYGRDWE